MTRKRKTFLEGTGNPFCFFMKSMGYKVESRYVTMNKIFFEVAFKIP